ncbi:hypothetical protein DAPPUDRAFT_233741 [Daphnia pulex]|uniref:Uncharacterized protein n=1 Tax=Daphnia pulex TaxID=6669 RepID=E9FVL0_DAPPU|nr:hypothetical protein DAPPUDRAFT_233741 [Daphnia pulex]|eukprot:EFX89089.1 hypothetical protein DAPPUDRAFT_233741 [Daphnia pulex]
MLPENIWAFPLIQKIHFILTYPIPCVPSIKLAKKTEMKLEASRFGNHAIQHIQIPEAE